MVTWGGWEGHEPQKTSAIFADVLRGEGYDVEYYNTLDIYLDAEKMASYDLIVPMWTITDSWGSISRLASV